MVGRALETMLETGGYGARFLGEPAEDKFRVLIANSQVLLVVPPLSGRQQRVFRSVMLGSESPADIAVLNLIPANGAEEPAMRQGVLFWPCSGKELKRAIEAALVARK